jgi:hypothetical protein
MYLSFNSLRVNIFVACLCEVMSSSSLHSPRHSFLSQEEDDGGFFAKKAKTTVAKGRPSIYNFVSMEYEPARVVPSVQDLADYTKDIEDGKEKFLAGYLVNRFVQNQNDKIATFITEDKVKYYISFPNITVEMGKYIRNLFDTVLPLVSGVENGKTVYCIEPVSDPELVLIFQPYVVVNANEKENEEKTVLKIKEATNFLSDNFLAEKFLSVKGSKEFGFGDVPDFWETFGGTLLCYSNSLVITQSEYNKYVRLAISHIENVVNRVKAFKNWKKHSHLLFTKNENGYIVNQYTDVGGEIFQELEKISIEDKISYHLRLLNFYGRFDVEFEFVFDFHYITTRGKMNGLLPNVIDDDGFIVDSPEDSSTGSLREQFGNRMRLPLPED